MQRRRFLAGPIWSAIAAGFGLAPLAYAAPLVRGARASAIAPVYVAGFAGQPVILGQPAVGATVTVLSGVLSAGAPTPTRTYQWYVRDSKGDAGTAIAGMTSASPTFTNAHCMKEVRVAETSTNSAGSATVYSAWSVVVPAGWSVGMGPINNTAQSQDPDDATVYSASTLYKLGDVVSVGGNKYICRQPFSYAIDPSTADISIWQPISTVWYFDLSAGTNGTGTKLSPFNDIDEVRKRVTQNTTGYVSQPSGTAFLFKRGCTGRGSISVNAWATHTETSLSTASRFVFGCYGTSTDPLPIVYWAPPPQAIVTAAGWNPAHIWMNGSGCLVLNLDLRDTNLGQLAFQITGMSGTVAVNDTLTFSSGGIGTVTDIFTQGASTWYIVAMTSGNMAAGNTFTGTGGASSSGTVSTATNAFNYIGGLSGNDQQHWKVGGVTLRNIAINGVTLSNTADETKGDTDVISCTFINCHSLKDSGSPCDGGHGTRYRIWFNHFVDCGPTSSLLGHGGPYLDDCRYTSVFFNKVEMTANYGNQAFIYHGVATDVEWGWNSGQGTRSGIGVNDGYGNTNPAEVMVGIRVHHNLIKSIGKLSGQTSNSLGAEITCASSATPGSPGSWFHDNVFQDAGPCVFYSDRATGASSGSDSKLSDFVLAHNTWWNSQLYVGALAGGSASLITNLDVENNLCATDQAQVPYLKGYTMSDGQLTEDCNAFYRADAGALVTWNNGSSPANYTNITAADGSGSLNAAHSAFETNGKRCASSPFVNTATGDFNLAAAVPPRGAGSDMRRKLQYAAADYAGNSRTTATPHIGALQTA